MYNKIEIEKNCNMLINSLEGVLIKLDINPENQILQERVEVSLALADFALHSLSRFHDSYIDFIKEMVSEAIEEYSARYQEISSKALKLQYHLAPA